MLNNKKDYEAAVGKLTKWAYHYYVLDDPIVIDEEYDKLYKEVENYESKHSEFIRPDSPTQRVGDVISDRFEKSRHLTKMWSMDNVFNIEDFKDWVSGIKKQFNGNFNLYAEPKFDGLSLNLVYGNGELVRAETRGDGIVGENVTLNAKTIATIPLKIDYKDLIEIRGEVVMPKENFIRLNEIRLKNNEPTFSNPRNAAAGSLRQLDPKITAERHLVFLSLGYRLSF